jgi:hypothetical protein
VFVPAWYLRNGRINAADNTLENASSSCERWGIFCAALVGFAVIAELVIAFVEPPYNIFLKLSAPTDAAVAIGIVGEVLFGMWDGRIQTELRNRSSKRLADATEGAARAIERAAAAELEAERLRKELAWRRISPNETLKMSEVLSRPDLPKFGLRIEHPANDPEVITFANDIAEVFRKNGWPVLFISTVSSHTFSGMMIPLYGPEETDACGITRLAFQNAGIEFLGGYPPPSSGMSMGSGDTISGPVAIIHLGSKPKPNLD